MLTTCAGNGFYTVSYVKTAATMYVARQVVKPAQATVNASILCRNLTQYRLNIELPSSNV